MNAILREWISFEIERSAPDSIGVTSRDIGQSERRLWLSRFHRAREKNGVKVKEKKKREERKRRRGTKRRERKIAKPRETRADVCQMNFRFALKLVTLDKMVGERGIDPDEKESLRVERLSDDREPVIRKYSCHICTGYITFLGSRSLRSKRDFSPMIAHRCQCFSFDRCRYS